MSDQLTQDPEAIRSAVRARYAAAARSVSGELPQAASCCAGDGASCWDTSAQADCCGPAAKDACCDTAATASGGCGCA